MKYSSKSIATTFFQETETEIKETRTITTFQCQCGAKRSQDLKKGYVNLLSHIKDCHKDVVERLFSGARLVLTSDEQNQISVKS